MEAPPYRFMEALPGSAGIYVVAAVVVLAVLATGLLLVATAIRHEDTETGVDRRAPGPFTRAVRRTVGLRVYTGGDFAYGVPMRHPDARRPPADEPDIYGLPRERGAYGALASSRWDSGPAAEDTGTRMAPQGSSRDEVTRLLESLAPEAPAGWRLVLAAVAPDARDRTEVLAWVPLGEYERARHPAGYHGPASPNR